MDYIITAAGNDGFRVSLQLSDVSAELVLGHFGSLEAAKAFVQTMRQIDRGATTTDARREGG